MLLSKSKVMVIIISMFLISTVGIFAQSEKSCCAGKEGKDDNCKTKVEDAPVMQDSTHSHKMHEGYMHSSDESTSSMVCEGEIDLTSIDANKDGMVYQDQMCWNVISDESGDCLKCGMIPKEVSLEKTKANLEKHKYKVK
jgi:hypothetical protein